MTRKEDKAATRAKLIEVAREVFDTVGYEMATMRVISTKAAVSTGSIFSSFADKRELYAAAYGHPPVTPEQGRVLLKTLSEQANVSIRPMYAAFFEPFS